MNAAERVKCVRLRSCGWRGTSDKLVMVPFGRYGAEQVASCPKCGCREFHALDQLSELEQRLLDAVGKAAAEFKRGQGAPTELVRWHLKGHWENRELAVKLNRMASDGHVVRRKDDRGKIRWKLPKKEGGAA